MISSLLARSGRSRDNIEAPFSASTTPKPAPKKVLVTGAGGRTGMIVVRKLLELGVGEGKQFESVRAMVRSPESAEKLATSLKDLQGIDIVTGDVTDTGTLEDAFKGMNAVVVCTSAQPRISKLSLAKTIALKVVTLNQMTSKPQFWFDEGQGPEQVDWLGQRAQFEAAEAAGVRHIVVVSSMCGTKPEHFLNTNLDNIVLWKRKAECALTKSGIPYTIIHPGGLLPHEGFSSGKAEGKKRQLYVGVDDDLLEEKDKNMVTREDLAEVCVRCIVEPDVAAGRSFDLGSGPEDEGTPFEGRPGDLKALLDTLGGKNTAYKEADAEFAALDPRPIRGDCCY